MLLLLWKRGFCKQEAGIGDGDGQADVTSGFPSRRGFLIGVMVWYTEGSGFGLRVVREGKSESIDLFPVALGAVVSLFRGMEINRIWPVLLAVAFHGVEIAFGFGLAIPPCLFWFVFPPRD